MAFIDKLEKRFGRYAIPNLSLWIVVGQILVFGLAIMDFPVDNLIFYPDMVASGQAWRLLTFIFQPPLMFGTQLFLIFYWYLLWLFGSTLEKQWGEFRFNVFMLIGLVCTMAAGMLNWVLLGSGGAGYFVDNVYLLTSITFAFAILFPNFEMLFFFVLPVKIKWLSLITLGLWVFSARGFFDYTLMIAALANVAIFFGPSFKRGAVARQRRVKYEKEQKVEREAAFHTCVVCGKTDNDDPDMEFAYKDGQGYCKDHWAEMDKQR